MAGEIYTTAAIILGASICLALQERSKRKRAERLLPTIEDPLLKMTTEQWQEKEIDYAWLKTYDEEAKKIARKYKHSDIKTHNIDGEIVSYGIYANEDFLPSRAILYFRGDTYNLDINAEGSYYFADDFWPSEEVVKTIKPLLPEISRTVTMFNLYENPQHEFWNLDTLSCLDAEYTVHGDADTLLDLVFFQWYFYTERDALDPDFPLYYLTNITQDPQNELALVYTDNALYQFIMGWMMATSPGFFLLNPDYFVGRDMMLKAHQLEPTNPLYKWAVSDQLNLTRAETRTLAAQVQASEFDVLEPFIRDYFMEIVQGDALTT